jgi:uroporphyrinogen decarboxylase
MNGRERVLATINGQPHDRVPVAQHNFPFAARHVGITMEQFRRAPDKAARALADTAHDFGYDCIIMDMDTCTLAEACGATCQFPEDEPARVVRPAVKAIQDVPGLPLPDPHASGRLPLWLETTRCLRRLVGDELAIMGRADQGPFGLLFLLRDSREFLMDLMEVEEGVILAALEHCAHAGASFARAQLEAGADITSIGDSAAGQSVVSPRVYHRFAQPMEKRYRRLMGPGLLSLHICGKTDQIIAGMAATGAEILELDHWNDLEATFKAIPQQTCVFGNLDPASVLAQGTAELVRQRSLKAIEIARRADGRLILCPGCTVGANTPPENVRAMSDAARQTGNRRGESM